jgi:hypothetical protein
MPGNVGEHGIDSKSKLMKTQQERRDLFDMQGRVIKGFPFLRLRDRRLCALEESHFNKAMYFVRPFIVSIHRPSTLSIRDRLDHGLKN